MESELEARSLPIGGQPFYLEKRRVSIPMDRFDSSEFKILAPKSRRGARSIATNLKTLKSVIKETWAQRPETVAPLRKRSVSRESTGSTRTRAASLEKLQTGSIKSRTNLRSRHEVANTVRN